jgi:carbamoyl-phosphate synthase large subunit
MCIPPQALSASGRAVIASYVNCIAKVLNIKGPFNIQFVVKNGRVYVIECNLRASRSMPFVSKLVGVNLMEIAASAILGNSIKPFVQQYRDLSRVGVKVPQFSFMQLEGADPHLGVEMQSTGEVACFGESFYDALIKAFVAAGYRLPKPDGNILITVGGPILKKRVLPLVEDLQKLGFNIFATEHTADFLIRNGFQGITVLHKIGEPNRKPNLQDYLVQGRLDLIINIPSTTVFEKYAKMLEDEYLIRRKAVELGVPVLTTFETARVFVQGLAWIKTNKSAHTH